MSFTAPQERTTAPHPQQEPDAAASPQEIKYRHDAASYVAAMLTELRQIAGKAGFDKLVSALDSAYYEAYGAMDSQGRNTAPPPREKLSPRMEQSGS
jgi:hypothetical protein